LNWYPLIDSELDGVTFVSEPLTGYQQLSVEAGAEFVVFKQNSVVVVRLSVTLNETELYAVVVDVVVAPLILKVLTTGAVVSRSQVMEMDDV
jgi:hypothetical protein